MDRMMRGQGVQFAIPVIPLPMAFLGMVMTFMLGMILGTKKGAMHGMHGMPMKHGYGKHGWEGEPMGMHQHHHHHHGFGEAECGCRKGEATQSTAEQQMTEPQPV